MKKNVMCAYFTEEHEQIMDGPVPWNSIEDILLIQFIENHPCLYDISCKEYQLSELKSDLWHEIGDRLNKDATECSNRWTFIQDNYESHQAKPMDVNNQVPRTRAELMSFLDRVTYSSMRGRYSTQYAEYSYVPDIEPIENGIEIPTEQFDGSIGPNASVAVATATNTTTTINQIEHPTPFAIYDSGKSNKSSNSGDRPRLNVHTKNHAQQQQQSNVRYSAAEQDETDLFFAAMAQCVKKLPPGERAKLRIQIGALIGTAEIEYYKDQDQYQNFIGGTEVSPPSTSSNFSQSYEDLYKEVKGNIIPPERANDTNMYVPWSDNN